MLWNAYRKTLLASSGDGSVLVLEVREDLKARIVAHTESLEDEILGLVELPGRKKSKKTARIACATGRGGINIFGWGYWGRVLDRLKPKFHARSSIEAIAAASEHIYTGTSEGQLYRTFVKGGLLEEPKVLETFEDVIERIVILYATPDLTRLALICTHEAKVYIYEDKIVSGDSHEEQLLLPERKKTADSSSFFNDLIN